MVKQYLTITLITLMSTCMIPAPVKDAEYKLKKLTEKFDRLKKRRYSKHTEYAMGRIVGQLKDNNMFTQAHFFEEDIREWIAQATPHKVTLIENIIDQSRGTALSPDLAEEDLGINPTNKTGDQREESAFEKKEEHRTDDQAEGQSVEDLQIGQGTEGEGSTVD